MPRRSHARWEGVKLTSLGFALKFDPRIALSESYPCGRYMALRTLCKPAKSQRRAKFCNNFSRCQCHPLSNGGLTVALQKASSSEDSLEKEGEQGGGGKQPSPVEISRLVRKKGQLISGVQMASSIPYWNNDVTRDQLETRGLEGPAGQHAARRRGS